MPCCATLQFTEKCGLLKGTAFRPYANKSNRKSGTAQWRDLLWLFSSPHAPSKLATHCEMWETRSRFEFVLSAENSFGPI
jgi:hypothetical protein